MIVCHIKYYKMDKITYPITKSQLQKGFEIKDSIRKKLVAEFVDAYIDNQIFIIASNMIKQTISPEEYAILSGERTMVDNQSKERCMYSIRPKQQYKYVYPRLDQFVSDIRDYLNTKYKKIFAETYDAGSTIPKEQYDYIKTIIFNNLQSKFPDLSILTDPLKEYILIDWN